VIGGIRSDIAHSLTYPSICLRYPSVNAREVRVATFDPEGNDADLYVIAPVALGAEKGGRSSRVSDAGIGAISFGGQCAQHAWADDLVVGIQRTTDVSLGLPTSCVIQVWHSGLAQDRRHVTAIFSRIVGSSPPDNGQLLSVGRRKVGTRVDHHGSKATPFRRLVVNARRELDQSKVVLDPVLMISSVERVDVRPNLAAVELEPPDVVAVFR